MDSSEFDIRKVEASGTMCARGVDLAGAVCDSGGGGGAGTGVCIYVSSDFTSIWV
jgi:hypothetical protein